MTCVFASLLARQCALGRFPIARLCFAPRTAPYRETQDGYIEPQLLTSDLDAIVNAHWTRRFHSLAVHMDQAAGYGISRLGTALEKAREPQPLVDTQAG
jgi:hypothetical protein